MSGTRGGWHGFATKTEPKQSRIQHSARTYLPSEVDVSAATRGQAVAPGAVVDGHAQNVTVLKLNGQNRMICCCAGGGAAHAVRKCAIEVEYVAAKANMVKRRGAGRGGGGLEWGGGVVGGRESTHRRTFQEEYNAEEAAHPFLCRERSEMDR